MGAAAGTKPIRAAQKVLLVYGFQDFPDGALDDFVLQRRYPNRPRFALSLGDVHPPDRLMAVLLCLHPLVQPLEILLQLLPVLFLCDAIHAHRSILTDSLIGACQKLHLDEMC